MQDTGETIKGVSPRDLLFVPDPKFFRRRGMQEIVFLPYDVYGNLLTENSKPVGAQAYLAYLKSVLPEYFIGTTEFAKYREGLLAHEAPQPGLSYGW